MSHRKKNPCPKDSAFGLAHTLFLIWSGFLIEDHLNPESKYIQIQYAYEKKKSHHPLLDCGSLLRHREVEVCERVNTPSPYRCVLSMCTHQIVWFLYIYIFWKKHEFHLKFIHFNSPRFPWWALSFFPSYAFWWKGVECGWSPSWRYSRRGFTLGFCLHPTSPATPPAPLFSWEASIRGDIGCGLWRQLVSEKLVCGINQGQVLPRIDPWGPNSLEATIQHHLGCWPQR